MQDDEKSEIRISKSETNPKCKYQMFKTFPSPVIASEQRERGNLILVAFEIHKLLRTVNC